VLSNLAPAGFTKPESGTAVANRLKREKRIYAVEEFSIPQSLNADGDNDLSIG